MSNNTQSEIKPMTPDIARKLLQNPNYVVALRKHGMLYYVRYVEFVTSARYNALGYTVLEPEEHALYLEPYLVGRI